MALDDELYQERILDHYEEPFHRGHCPAATHAHEDENPLCGDVVRVELAIDADGTIREAYFEGDGCCISQASASMLLEQISGKRVDDVKTFTAQDMLQLFGAKLTPNRQKCCLLCWRAVQTAVYSPIAPGDQACEGGRAGSST
jgi:nitrogen fixation NifU-like protein